MVHEPPHFHGAELRKIEDERRWERKKVFLNLAGQLAIALAGLWIGITLERFRGSQQAEAQRIEHSQQAEAKRIEYRTQFYKDVSQDLNMLYAFACSIGDYSLLPPSQFGEKKRRLEAAFAQNLPLMSLNTYSAFKEFVRNIVKSADPSKHFEFIGERKSRRKAYDQRQLEFKQRGQHPPPVVSDEELKEWFTDTPINLQLTSVSYARLLASVAKDSGFGLFDERQAIAQLVCLPY